MISVMKKGQTSEMIIVSIDNNLPGKTTEKGRMVVHEEKYPTTMPIDNLKTMANGVEVSCNGGRKKTRKRLKENMVKKSEQRRLFY